MRVMQRIFARYGTRAALNGRSVFVFFKNTGRSTQETYTPLGRVCREQYVCCLESSAVPRVGDSLTVDGEGFEITDVRAMKLGSRELYWRAVARKKGGTDTWGM